MASSLKLQLICRLRTSSGPKNERCWSNHVSSTVWTMWVSCAVRCGRKTKKCCLGWRSTIVCSSDKCGNCHCICDQRTKIRPHAKYAARNSSQNKSYSNHWAEWERCRDREKEGETKKCEKHNEYDRDIDMRAHQPTCIYTVTRSFCGLPK